MENKKLYIIIQELNSILITITLCLGECALSPIGKKYTDLC